MYHTLTSTHCFYMLNGNWQSLHHVIVLKKFTTFKIWNRCSSLFANFCDSVKKHFILVLSYLTYHNKPTAKPNRQTYRIYWMIQLVDTQSKEKLTLCNQIYMKREDFRLPSALVMTPHSVNSGQKLSDVSTAYQSRHFSTIHESRHPQWNKMTFRLPECVNKFTLQF